MLKALRIPVFPVLLVFSLFISCSGSADMKPGVNFASPALKAYKDFIRGCSEAQPGITNNFSPGDRFYVELQTRAVPYIWVYSISGSGVSNIDEGSFDLSSPGKSGAPVRYIWKFACFTQGGSVSLTYYYRSVVKKDAAVATNIYLINIK